MEMKFEIKKLILNKKMIKGNKSRGNLKYNFPNLVEYYKFKFKR